MGGCRQLRANEEGVMSGVRGENEAVVYYSIQIELRQSERHTNAVHLLEEVEYSTNGFVSLIGVFPKKIKVFRTSLQTNA